MKKITCSLTVKHLWFLIIQFIPTSYQSPHLLVTYSHAQLPIPDNAHRLWYDGKDSVFLFGGSFEAIQAKSVLRYSLSTDSIHLEGSLPIPARHGSVHSDWDGNIFYFGADYSSKNDDKVIKYSPTTNSSDVVAQVPYDIFGIPTIKVGNTVLILGGWDTRLEIFSYDLATGQGTTLEVKLPISVCFGAAVKFNKNTAYLFPYDSGTWWEMDLRTTSFKLVLNIPLPKFGHYPAVVTDGTLVYILARFKSSPKFPKNHGIFAIDPVAETSQFLHLDNWLGANESHLATRAVYIPKLRRIYYFGGHSPDWPDYRDYYGIFYVDLTPLSKANQTEPIVTSINTTEIENQSMTQTSTQFPEDSTVESAPTLANALNFMCSSLLRDGTSKCVLIDDRTDELDVFCEASITENVTCHKTQASIQPHNSEVVKLTLRKTLVDEDCNFMVDFVLDVGSRLDCCLKNGVRINFTFGTEEEQMFNSHFVITGLLITLVIVVTLVTAWIIVNYMKKRKAQTNHSVVWKADYEMK